MMILKALFLFIWCISVNSRYTLYYSDIRQGSYATFDCLYAYIVDSGKENSKRYIGNYHLIPYCRRPDDDDDEEQDGIGKSINKNIVKTISFSELKKQNITSEQLLQWFAPTDVAEKYQMNVNDSDVFHNCSSPWFGSQCQYKLDYNSSLTFADIINATLYKQSSVISDMPSGTCYRFLSGCDRGLWPLCIDWREICDGKIDCMNGEDEQWCNELERNQCNDREYRCHYGGQCIPLSFLKDNRLSIDCLDGSDERDDYTYQIGVMNSNCLFVSTFRCQERIGRYPWSFQCGDGAYVVNSRIPSFQNHCANQKDKQLSRAMLTSMDHISNINCRKAFYCALHFNRTFTGYGKKSFCIVQFLGFLKQNMGFFSLFLQDLVDDYDELDERFILKDSLPNSLCASRKFEPIIYIQVELLLMFPRYCCKKTCVEDDQYLETMELFLSPTFQNVLGSMGQWYVGRFPFIIDDVWDEDCEPLSEHCSSKWLVIPAHPILFGLFQFVYLTNRPINEFKRNIAPDFVCFNAQRCPMLLPKIIPIEIVDGLTCFHPSNLTDTIVMRNFDEVLDIFSYYDQSCLEKGLDQSCDNSSDFYCNESMKCISYHRVGDSMPDCYFFEDESFNTCQLNDSNRFKCQSDSNKCLLPVAIGNGIFDCPSREDEAFVYAQNFAALVSFPDLCNRQSNGYLDSLDITGLDETDCDWWPCDNPYTHCDQFWHCRNGADELNCPNTKCSFNEHECYNEHFASSYCLSLTHIYEKYFDSCNNTYQHRQVYFYNGTIDINDHYFSWNDTKCLTLEKLCHIDHHSQTSLMEEDICLYRSKMLDLIYIPDVKSFQNSEYLCNFTSIPFTETYIVYFFKATQIGYLPEISMNISIPTISKPNQKEEIILNIDAASTLYCHRGIAALLSDHNGTRICLCPPNYFGARCQWQNQRISLTIQLVWRHTVSSTIIFQVIILLIDEQGQIAPYHEQITYIPNRDCNTKFNIYLLYPHRPKSLLHKYSIRIDLYEKTKLNYWTSWHISIPFSFLPVNRIVTQLMIPEVPNNEECILSCGEHGQCRRYTNNQSLFFCHCDEGYSGSHCQIKHQCKCANDSLCLASSICICPLYKFGSYCHLTHSLCQSSNNPCQHKGLCVPTDVRIHLTDVTCFCPEDYSGERCENENNRIDIHLDEGTISTTSLILIHFITAFKDAEHERITVLKKIPFNQNILTIPVSQPFHLLFVQIPKKYYYLTVLREVFIPSEHISAEIHPKQRCSSIRDLLNDTFLQYEYLRRVKYYPMLCRKHLQLMCFYDNDLMCVCDLDRFSNCFLFNHTMNHDCQGSNSCQNNGECFQNNETCPTKSLCICPDCYYGDKCQFSTKGFLFSLDSILGYHIKPNVSLNQQPPIIKTSIAITIIMLVAGLISGLLSFITFRRKKPRQVGTGYYLSFSSMTSVLIVITLNIKFWQLFISQKSSITNQSSLYFSCILIDVSLRILLASLEWLNTCVALERMMSVIKGTGFDKKYSRKISKRIIVSVFLLTIVTHIHDPIHRQLIDDYDIDEKRTWCFVQYSSSVNIYNSFITLFHFLTPFSINIISAIWIIISLAYSRRGVQPDQTLKEHLKHQIQKHRHLLIGPCALILLSLPRLIISFVSECMRSARQPWLYLFGYYISFIPSMLTFIVFILPSELYKDEFHVVLEKTMRRFRTNA